MNIAFKVVLIISASLVGSHEIYGQINFRKRVTMKYELPSSFESKAPTKRWNLPGLRADKQSTFKSASMYRLLSSSSNNFAGDPFWVGSVTQQSYNHGKIGRYYYWDLQGNLRDSYMFLDIAGKNKRGLKLVFPRHRLLF